MNHSLNPKTTTLTVRNSISPATAGRGFLFMALALAWFALFPGPNAFGVTPAPDGGYPNNNTAEGTNALNSVSSFGTDNTAIGFEALFSNTSGSDNTATGSLALFNNTLGSENTATGFGALFSNTSGSDNTAIGLQTLGRNTTGTFNTATGFHALFSNTTGQLNTATGFGALGGNTTGSQNTANGVAAAMNGGNNNTAQGFQALL